MIGDICVMRLLEIGSCRQRQINDDWREKKSNDLAHFLVRLLELKREIEKRDEEEWIMIGADKLWGLIVRSCYMHHVFVDV